MRLTICISALALLFLAGSSCRQERKSGEADVHDHEHASVQLVAYSDSFEVFAEADPFVAGEAGQVLAHFSHIPGFKPLDSAVVTIRLTVSGRTVSQQLDKPLRKGIYRFEITPESAGTGTVTFDIREGEVTNQVVVPGIVVYSTEGEAGKAAEAAVPAATNTVSFTKEQSWKIDFSTELPLIGPFGQVIKATAQILPATGDEVTIPAKASGIAVFSGIEVTPGKTVSAGQALFHITGGDLAENNLAVNMAGAASEFERTKRDYERKKELAGDRVISQKELEAALASYETAKARHDALNRNFSQGSQAVTSPVNGFIRDILVTNGQYVEAGQDLVSVIRNKKLILRADVPARHLPLLDKISDAVISTSQGTFRLSELNGSIVSIGRVALKGNHMIPVTLGIDNTAGLIPGSFAGVYLKTLTNSEALTVPDQALIEEQGNYFVFVQVTPELFEKREVRPGATDGKKTEITAGLKPGERVVTRGAIMIKLAKATGTLDAHSGHVH